jgi:hypothetical protein
MVFWHGDKMLGGYLAGSGICSLMYRWLDLVAIHQPESDFWKVNDVNGKNEDGKVEGRAPVGLWAKLKWWTDLVLSSR